MANMKSSDSVFTRQDPFLPDLPIGKTHYHPSHIQRLSKKKRKTTLSPVRLNQPASPPPQIHSPGPEDLCFLDKANHLVTFKCPNTDGQPSFSESWPSSDLGSSPPNTRSSSNMEAPRESGPDGKSSVSPDQGDQQDSVLAKYIERFRRGRPQSREERQQMASAVGEERQPFWWMSPSSLPSSYMPTQTTDKDLTLTVRDNRTTNTVSTVIQFRRGSTPSPSRELLDLSALGLSDTSQSDLGDPEVLQLQERANRLLQKSEHSISSGSIPISSEGLGCSDFSPISVDEPVRRPMIPSLMKSTTAAVNAGSASLPVGPSQNPFVAAASVARRRPEEDILFQWRLRRKMEQARQWPHSLSQQYSNNTLNQPTVSRLSPSFHQSSVTGQTHKQQSVQPPDPSRRVTPSFICAPQQETKESHGPFSPTAAPSPSPHLPVSCPTVSKLPMDAPVPAHMHLLCDVLPCPAQSSQPLMRQKSSQRLDGSWTKMAPKKPQQATGNSTDTSTEEPTSKHESSPPPASSGTTEEECAFHHRRAQRKTKENLQTKESEIKAKRTEMSSRKQKKSSRHHIGDGDHAERPNYPDMSSLCHNRGPEKVPPWTEHARRDGRQQERCQGLSREGRPGDRAPPPSPIHSALGQVVSEVLFPTLDSPSAQRTPVSSDSPRHTPPAPPQSPVALANVQQPMEVISQLLQEAEDSDEKEFEDDPLLQVLRKQRKWVKEQISEVDSMLDELQGE